MTNPHSVTAKSKNFRSRRWRKEVERVLITEEQLARRIKTLAREIERDFRGREMVVVSLLNGTVMFLADLIRHLNLPLRLDFMGVSSYGAGTESGELVFTKELRLDVRGRDVLLVDDILDTGKTLSRVLPKIPRAQTAPHQNLRAARQAGAPRGKNQGRLRWLRNSRIYLSSATGWILPSVIATSRSSACCIRIFTNKRASGLIGSKALLRLLKQQGGLQSSKTQKHQ